MAFVSTHLGTPILAGESLVERLEYLGRNDLLGPETHRAILDRLARLEPELLALARHDALFFPGDAPADFACAVTKQAARVRYGPADRLCFEREIAEMKAALRLLRMWSATATVMPAQRVTSAPARRIGPFTVFDGGRA